MIPNAIFVSAIAVQNCISEVTATCGAPMITSPVVRKPSEVSFGLALWRAGKPLQNKFATGNSM